MFRYWVFFLVLVFSLPAAAEEFNPQDVHMTIVANAENNKEVDENMPRCDNSALMKRVLEKIAQYQESHPQNTIVGQRRQALIFKTLDQFEEIKVANFENAENYRVADVLLMDKINRGLSDDDIRLCRGNGVDGVYLVIFRDKEAYRVEIVNFVPLREEKDFAFYFNPLSEDKAEAEPNVADVQNDAETAATAQEE